MRGLKKFGNGLNNLPSPENLVVIGGAGSGKSTVIECLTQWTHRELVKEGDIKIKQNNLFDDVYIKENK